MKKRFSAVTLNEWSFGFCFVSFVREILISLLLAFHLGGWKSIRLINREWRINTAFYLKSLNNGSSSSRFLTNSMMFGTSAHIRRVKSASPRRRFMLQQGCRMPAESSLCFSEL